MKRALLLVLLILAAPADASRYRVGIGDQEVAMFTDAAFQPLGVKRVRYIVPWDWRRQRDKVALYMRTARERRIQVLVHFTASPNCWDGRRYSPTRECRAPSARKYAASVRAFRRQFPWQHLFGAWNEVNHSSQPTFRRPRLAARYSDALIGTCPECRVVGLDLLDTSSAVEYARAFRRHNRHRVRLWGLHNYSDVNRFSTARTRALLEAVPGQVWLTETGGIVNFGSSFPYSTKRAARATGHLFDLADELSRPGLRARITRVYAYTWRGEYRPARFDAGIVGPTGKPRPAYDVFRAKLATRSK